MYGEVFNGVDLLIWVGAMVVVLYLGWRFICYTRGHKRK